MINTVIFAVFKCGYFNSLSLELLFGTYLQTLLAMPFNLICYLIDFNLIFIFQYI